MYSPLPENPPGPVTRNPLAAPLRGTLRVFNVSLGAFGVLLLSSALYMFIVYHRTGYVPPPSPAPPSFFITLMDGTAATSWTSLWFIWLTGGAGAFFLVVASSGFAGLHPENRRRLFVHIVMLSGLILAEAAVLVVLFIDSSWRKKIPEDPTGFWPIVQQFVDENARMVKILALSVLLAQLVGLGAASWLHSMYQSAYEDWLDGIEAAQARANEQLGRAAEQAYTGVGPSVWRSRIHDKYGIDSREWEGTAATAAAVQSAGFVNENGAPAPPTNGFRFTGE